MKDQSTSAFQNLNSDYFLTADYKDQTLYLFFIQKNDNTVYFKNETLEQKAQIPTLAVVKDQNSKEKLFFLRAEMNYQNYLTATISIENDLFIEPIFDNEVVMKEQYPDYFLTADYKNSTLYTFFIQKNENTLYFKNDSLIQKGEIPTITVLTDQNLNEKLSFLRAEISYQNYITANTLIADEDSLLSESIPNETAMSSTPTSDTLLSANYKTNTLYVFNIPNNNNTIQFYDENDKRIGTSSSIIDNTQLSLLNFLPFQTDQFNCSFIKQHNKKAFEYLEEDYDDYDGISDYL